MTFRRRTSNAIRRSLALLSAAVLAATLVGAVAAVPAAADVARPAASPVPAMTAARAAVTHKITYDSASLMIDGQRTPIWSAEFHYWRLPSQSLWLDVLQKMKAEGYNAISVYFDWAYHSPKQGVYDFTGVRDVDKLLDMAQDVGLYVIARPGPYINAETSGGGFPGWLTQVAGKARTDAPDYLAAADEWMTQIDGILAKHQLTNGGGTVILEQIENELASSGTTQKNYMQHLYDKVRADGIDVPIFHNDKGRNGIWVPKGSNVSGTVEGPTDMYAFDGYPGGTCTSDGAPGTPSAAPDWGIWGAGGATGGSTASPNTPGFVAEFGGGWFDFWGSKGTYDCTAVREGPGYERVFYDTNIANGLSIQNFYMSFGGTSWGWLPAPVVYTSYDYGAAIDEARQIRPKATTMKELGLFLQSVDVVDDLAKGDPVTPSSAKVRVYHDVNPETGGDLYVALHNPSSATTNDPFTFPLKTSDGTYTVPQAGTLRVNGQDAKMLVADYNMDGQHLVYSTSEIMTHLSGGGRDLALLYGRDGEDGETVLRYSSAPVVTTLSGSVSSTYDAATGDLRLNYTHAGLAQVSITGGGRPPLTLLLADTTTAGTFWRQDTVAGAVLERGPELVRTAGIAGSTLALTGDTDRSSGLQVWAPSGVSSVTWNGSPVDMTSGVGGSLDAATNLAGPAPLDLPDLTKAAWSYAPGSPESASSFDDSTWTAANRTTTTSTTKPPAGQPILTADDYGFHQGDVWYRGTYTGTADTTALSLTYGGGGAGMLQAWLDGVYLGQNVLPSGVSAPQTTGTAKFAVPADLRTGRHTLAVMVRNDGHNEDGGVNDAQKEGRGLISVGTSGSAGATATDIQWKIQGNQGGEDAIDTARGLNNVGGLYGERNGWYLPGYPDGSWPTVSLPSAGAMPGTSWYRTSFNLDVPESEDASLGLTIGNPTVPQSTGHYRALIYVNGWNIGQYIADVGPQHTFVVPNGVLNPRGGNTVAIAVTSDGGAGNGLESVVLTDLGTVQGGVPVTMNQAPDWTAGSYGTAGVPAQVSMDSLTSDAAATTKGGDIIHVTGSVTNHGEATATGVTASLAVPAGWSVTPSGPSAAVVLDAGKSETLKWTVTVPLGAAADDYEVVATAVSVQGGQSSTTGRTLTLPIRNAGDIYISDMAWVSSTSGYGTIGRDVNLSGAALTMNGTVYKKGIGLNSISTIVVDVPTGCTSFTSVVGLDVSSGGKGSVTFSVAGDGTTLEQSKTIAKTDPPIPLTVDITGVHRLTLTAGDAGDGNGHDNADWGDAEIHCSSASVPVPTITAVHPSAGPAAGGTVVGLTGTGFAAGSTISVDGSAPINPTSVSADGTSLTFSTPPHAAGTVEVTVTTDGATSAAADFTYVPVPTVVAVTPKHGPATGGTTVTLTGTGFTDGTTVSVDGAAPITPTSINADINSDSTTLTFTSPAHPAGQAAVTVTTAGGTSAAAAYTYDAVATVPATPAAPSVGVSDNKLNVSWVAPADGGAPITSYTVTLAAPGSPAVIRKVIGSTSTSLTGLPAGDYSATVVATNIVGDSLVSASSATAAVTNGKPVPLAVNAKSQCINGNAFVAVYALNGSASSADIRFTVGNAQQKFTSIAPGKAAYQLFDTGAATATSGQAGIAGYTWSAGVGYYATYSVPYAAITCR